MQSREERLRAYDAYIHEQERVARERPSGRPRIPGKPSQVPEPGGATNPPSRPPDPLTAARIQAQKDDATREQVYRQKKSRLVARIAEDRARESATRIFGEQLRKKSRGR